MMKRCPTSSGSGGGRIAVLSPMDSECVLLLSHLENRADKKIGGYLFSEGTLAGRAVVLIRTLIGTVNAAVCTALAIERYAVEAVILQGTSGAHDPALHQNDIVIGERMVSLTNTVSPKRKEGDGSDPFLWDEFGVQSYFAVDDSLQFANAFFSDPMLLAIAKELPYQCGKLKVGTIGCGDVWNREADLILHYHRKKGTDCEAMEGIGVAQVCAAYGVPMIEIRVISNNELNDQEHFNKETAINSQKFVMELLKAIST